MRIWYVSLYEPLPIGGIGIRKMRTGLLTDALVARGHEVELWLPGFEHVHHQHIVSDSSSEYICKNLTIQYIKGSGYKKDISVKRLVHNIQIARNFSKIASSRKNTPDIIITQIPSLELAKAVTAFSIKYDIPLVIDIRDLWPDVYKRIIPAKIHFLYKYIFFKQLRSLRFILEHATIVTAVSKEFLEWGRVNGNRGTHNLDRVFYIGYPCNEEKVLPNSKLSNRLKKEGVLHTDKIVFFSGTFCGSYDFEIVFKCAKFLSSKNKNIKFIFAGKGEGEDALKNISILSDNIIYLEWLNLNELKYMLSISAIGLAPYSEDSLMSLPNKPFEYMAAELPIVSSLKGELSQLLAEKQCGLTYDAKDFVDLAEKILYIVDNVTVSQSMGENGRKLIEEEFSSEHIYKNFVEHLKKIGE
jgi:glycosyltransferase involved in cell wall biosynthesis